MKDAPYQEMLGCPFCGSDEDVQVDHDGFCQRCSEGMREQEERREHGAR